MMRNPNPKGKIAQDCRDLAGKIREIEYKTFCRMCADRGCSFETREKGLDLACHEQAAYIKFIGGYTDCPDHPFDSPSLEEGIYKRQLYLTAFLAGWRAGRNSKYSAKGKVEKEKENDNR